MQIFFSIIIPTYNAQETIIRALQSCLNQTYQNFEIIVVDDNSTDKTVELIKKLNSKKIKIIQLAVNSGPSIARNTAWEQAKGDYIAFLDADDVWFHRKLELLNHVLNTKNIDYFGHGYSVQDFSFKKLTNQNIIKIRRYNFFQLLFFNITPTSCVVLKKSIKFRFNEKMRYCEDHELFLRIAKAHGLMFCDLKLATLGRAILSKGGLSDKKLQMRIGEIKMYYSFLKQTNFLIVFFPFMVLYAGFKHFLHLFFSLPSNRI